LIRDFFAIIVRLTKTADNLAESASAGAVELIRLKFNKVEDIAPLLRDFTKRRVSHG
jgi:hypothetical protein